MHVICDDITKKEVKEELYSKINFNDVDLVCGGPPCQGFSHAGKRFIDDPRNSLFKEYARVISIVKPSFLLWKMLLDFILIIKEKQEKKF